MTAQFISSLHDLGIGEKGRGANNHRGNTATYFATANILSQVDAMIRWPPILDNYAPDYMDTCTGCR